MLHRNLATNHLPGCHDHKAIADVLCESAEQWGINLDANVSAFTTDNGSNIVKALKDDLKKKYICRVQNIPLIYLCSQLLA